MKSIPADLAWLNLPNLPTPVKVLFSGYLLAIGLGLAMAGLQIMLTHLKQGAKFTKEMS